ncbi:hypothetical protein GCM10010411_70020 [Actinomadura fulvescens]|uniref:Glycosyltransferase n=1 Tax=Actinomadura fulvescens TaxID=46160 RepID=A0ABN3QDT2_9ACTN
MTVVIPVYNCLASLGRALDSVFDQSLGPGTDAVEIIAVDDGSTDGSGAELDRMAARHPRMTVVHQDNSGGPGAPRNVGLDRAAGEYVFFLDADDWLGPEALERMCGMADANGTDVVFGKYVGVGRGVPKAIFARTVPSTTLAKTPDLYGTLAVMKLFRTEPLRSNGVRFAEGVLSGEDVIFSAHAFLHARSFSVVGDYDCYYWVDREDGTSVMQNGGAPAAAYFPRMVELMEVVDRHVPPGPLYDRLIARHIEWDVLHHRFHLHYLTQDEAEQRGAEEAAADVLKRWLTPSVAALLPVHTKLIAYCVQHGRRTELREIIEFQHHGGRAAPAVVGDGLYARYPYFQDPVSAIPDSCYEISDRLLRVQRRFTEVAWRPGALELAGRVELIGVDEPQEITIVLRAKGGPDGSGEPGTRRISASRVPEEGPGAFRAAIPLGPGDAPADGVWEVHVEVRVGGFTVTRRLLAAEDVTLPGPRLVASGSVVTAVVDPGWRTLALRVVPDEAARLLEIDEVRWDGHGRLRVSGGIPSALPEGHAVRVSAEAVRRGDGPARQAAAEGVSAAHRLEVAAEFDLRGCPPGRWDTWLEISVDGVRLRGRVPLPRAGLPDASPSGIFRKAAPYGTNRRALAIKVVERPMARKVRRIARRLRSR